jgi:hypothetical protein
MAQSVFRVQFGLQTFFDVFLSPLTRDQVHATLSCRFDLNSYGKSFVGSSGNQHTHQWFALFQRSRLDELSQSVLPAPLAVRRGEASTAIVVSSSRAAVGGLREVLKPGQVKDEPGVAKLEDCKSPLPVAVCPRPNATGVTSSILTIGYCAARCDARLGGQSRTPEDQHRPHLPGSSSAGRRAIVKSEDATPMAVIQPRSCSLSNSDRAAMSLI